MTGEQTQQITSVLKWLRQIELDQFEYINNDFDSDADDWQVESYWVSLFLQDLLVGLTSITPSSPESGGKINSIIDELTEVKVFCEKYDGKIMDIQANSTRLLTGWAHNLFTCIEDCLPKNDSRVNTFFNQNVSKETEYLKNYCQEKKALANQEQPPEESKFLRYKPPMPLKSAASSR